MDTSPPLHQAAATKSANIVVAATALGTLLAIMLTTGLTIAIPAIRDQFHSTDIAVAWVLSGYTLAFAMFSLTGGALADKFGANCTFAIGLGVVAAGSILAALAPTVPVIVAGTLLAGAGAALVLPASLSIIQHTFRDDAKKRHRAISVWAASNAVGAAIGPVVCGALVSALSWRYLFGVIALLAVVFIIIGGRSIAKMPRHPHKLDIPGQVLMVVLLGVIAFVAHESAELPTGAILGGIVLVIVLMVAFWFVESRSASPMLPPVQLRDGAFGMTALVTIVGTGAFFGGIYIVSVALQDQFHMSAFVSGLALLPLAGGNIIAAVIAPRITTKIGTRGLMIVGGALLLIALLLFPLLFASYATLVIPMVLLGVAFGLLVPSTSAAGLARAIRGKEGVASGVTAGGRELGGALAAAMLLPLGAPAGLWTAAAIAAVALAMTIVGVRNVDHAPEGEFVAH